MWLQYTYTVERMMSLHSAHYSHHVVDILNRYACYHGKIAISFPQNSSLAGITPENKTSFCECVGKFAKGTWKANS